MLAGKPRAERIADYVLNYQHPVQRFCCNRVIFRRGLTLAWALIGLSALFFFSNSTMANTAGITIETVEYKGWKNNLRLANGTVELIFTLDVGPRIIRYGYVGGANVFKEFSEQIGKSGEKEWMIRGGHRLWHAPEDIKRTYDLDNAPVTWKKLSTNSVRVTQAVEPLTGLVKEMDITLAESGTGVTVAHRLHNTNLWDVELAPWALTVLAQGGVEIIPLPEKISHPGSLAPGEKPDYRGFLANQTMIVWPFTDLADSRWKWGTRYITLRQDSQAKTPTKLGLAHKLGWVGYLNKGVLFLKHFDYQEGKTYADSGSNFETFTNKDFLEAESLGPLTRIASGGIAEHLEKWALMKDVPADFSEAALDANVRAKADKLFAK